MSLTQEDVLRELELLPVWRAQSPAVASTPIEQTVSTDIEDVPAEPTPNVQTATIVVDNESKPEVRTEEIAPNLEKTTVAWMWVASPIKDTVSQSLLDGMVNAMRLQKNEMVLVHKRSEMARYQAKRMVLLGLNVANAVLAQPATDIQALRGRVHQLGETQYVVTHALQAMLEQPSLKKEVWHDLCLLLDSVGTS